MARDDGAPALLAAHPRVHEHESLPVRRVPGAHGAAAPEGSTGAGQAAPTEHRAPGAVEGTEVSDREGVVRGKRLRRPRGQGKG